MRTETVSTMKGAIKAGVKNYMLCVCPVCNGRVELQKCELDDEEHYTYRFSCVERDKLHDKFMNDNIFVDSIDQAVLDWNKYCANAMFWRSFYKYVIPCIMFLLSLIPITVTIISYFLFDIFPYGALHIFLICVATIAPLLIACMFHTKLKVAFMKHNDLEEREWKKKKNMPVIFQPSIQEEQLNKPTNSLMDKFVADNALIKEAYVSIESDMKQKIERVFEVSLKISEYLLLHPERMYMARRLIMYYNEQLSNIVSSYDKRNKMSDEYRDKYEHKVSQTLDKLYNVYVKTYAQLARHETDSMLSDLEVLMQELDMDEGALEVNEMVHNELRKET